MKIFFFHDRSKHIEIKCHYTWDVVQKRFIRIEYISFDKQVADVLTEPLS